MKDVPTALAQGIQQAAVLKRASHKDILVYRDAEDLKFLGLSGYEFSNNSTYSECDGKHIFRIGTRDSQLAVWQATLVQNLLSEQGVISELVYLKSEGDLDTITPIYELGVQGVFTKTLDTALLNDRIDLAVHSMKDVPTALAQGIQQAAVLERASHKDILVYRDAEDLKFLGLSGYEFSNNSTYSEFHSQSKSFKIATGSIRRTAQWLHRFPDHSIESLRGNVNNRLQKLVKSNWNGAIFAAAGLERIQLRPPESVDLDWMLPAPAQGAIMIVCRQKDESALQACEPLNHEETALCTGIERSFLSALMGGCSTPISAFAEIKNDKIYFKGNVVSPDGKTKVEIEKIFDLEEATSVGRDAAGNLLQKGGEPIMELIRKKGFVNE
jgi:hydroxymethylbilane synthase